MSTEDIFDLILGPEQEEPINPIEELLGDDPRVSTTESADKRFFFRDFLEIKEL